MNNTERSLIFRVADGEEKAFPICHFIYQFHLRAPMYNWLLSNRITGKNLLSYLNDIHKGSMLSLSRTILNNVCSRDKNEKVLLGRDLV